MRELKEEEENKITAKLTQYVDVEKLDFKMHILLLQKNKVFYARRSLYKACSMVSKKNVKLVGTLLGKMTHSGRFKLSITAMPILKRLFKYRVWLKKTAEQSFLHGHHILKTQIHKISSEIPKNTGVLVLSTLGKPIGFGVSSREGNRMSTQRPDAISIVNQADIGEYLRREHELF